MIISSEAKVSAAPDRVVCRSWQRRALISREIFVRVSLTLIAAILLICSLPGPDVGWLAWIALVPLIVACKDLHPLGAAGIGCVYGLVSGIGTYHWVFQIPPGSIISFWPACASRYIRLCGAPVSPSCLVSGSPSRFRQPPFGSSSITCVHTRGSWHSPGERSRTRNTET